MTAATDLLQPDRDAETVVDLAMRIVAERLSKQVHSTYAVFCIGDIRSLRELFDDGADALNWCFFGTGGVHGNRGGLDALFDPAHARPDPDVDRLTVLVVQPRLVRFYYGTLDVRREDVPWLRELAVQTMAGVARSQRGSWPVTGGGDADE